MAHPGEPPMYDLDALKLTLTRQERIAANIRGQAEHAEQYVEELKTLIRMKEDGKI